MLVPHMTRDERCGRLRVLAIAAVIVCLAAACARTQHEVASVERPRPPAIDTSGPGSDRIGVDVTGLLPARSIGERTELAGHVTLIRWWTDQCPYCAES